MAIHIGLLTLQLGIPGADSLKDKRQVVRSLVAHLRQRYNVTVAEVDDLNAWRTATLALAAVSNSDPVVHGLLEKIVTHVEDDGRAIVENYGIEML